MAPLTIEFSAGLSERLRRAAARQGESVQAVAEELLSEQLAAIEPNPADEREQVREALRSAGLLAELSPEMARRADEVTMTLEEVRAALDRAGGKPLSEVILEMRGPKE
jgi:hypothetical protein